MTVARRRAPRRWRRWLLGGLIGFVALTTLQVLGLRWIDPPTSAFMLARRGQALLAGDDAFRLQYRWRAADAISRHLPIALVAAEDQSFLDHHGFDLGAIERAIDRNARGGRLRGASTISQQVAKNLFLWRGGGYFRKGLEAWYTLLIETLWSKQRILEIYANVAEFGDGIYGAEAAAQAFFGQPASRLEPAQCARLAAVLPNPKRYNARQPGPYVQRRAAWIQRQVRQLGGPDYLRRAD